MKRRITTGLALTIVVCCSLIILGIARDSLAADRSAVQDFVTRFYQLCLDRDPDATGLNGWVSALLDGSQTGSDVANGFVFSKEFINKNTTNEEYLAILYEAFFNRNPDQGGWDVWLTELNGGTSREDVLNGFIFATEFAQLCDTFGILAVKQPRSPRELVEDFVTRFYQLCLDRNPDPVGLKGWTNNLLNQTQTGADVAEGFVYSPEFINKNTSNSDYLQILYEAFFDRNPDSSGWNSWMTELNAGKDRSEVLNGFIYSQEFTSLCDNFGIKAYDAIPPPPQPPANFEGSWVGQATSTTPYDAWGDPCGRASVNLTISNFQISGTAVDSWGDRYQVSGTVNSNGTISLGVAFGSDTVARFSGTLSGNSGSGTWSDDWGCRGTWTFTKR